MKARKITPALAVLVGLVSAATLTHASASDGQTNPPMLVRPIYSPSPLARMSLLHRVQNQCIAHGQACVINGTPCCVSTDACKGAFPNTTCQ
jgi:hypothetical protein